MENALHSLEIASAMVAAKRIVRFKSSANNFIRKRLKDRRSPGGSGGGMRGSSKHSSASVDRSRGASSVSSFEEADSVGSDNELVPSSYPSSSSSSSSSLSAGGADSSGYGHGHGFVAVSALHTDRVAGLGAGSSMKMPNSIRNAVDEGGSQGKGQGQGQGRRQVGHSNGQIQFSSVLGKGSMNIAGIGEAMDHAVLLKSELDRLQIGIVLLNQSRTDCTKF